MSDSATLVTADDLVGAPASTPPPVASEPTPGAEPSAPPIPKRLTLSGADFVPAEPEQNPFAGQRDALGREWHPAKFRLKDGKPQLDTQGRFVPLGLGQRAGAAAKKTEQAAEAPRGASFIPPDEAPPPEPGAMPVDQLAAEVAINLVQSALILIGQDEGVLTDFERLTLKGPLARILSKYNLGDKMTPELEFAAALAVIVMARLKRPKTMTWFQAKMLAVRGWFTRRKLAAIHNPEPSPAASDGGA